MGLLGQYVLQLITVALICSFVLSMVSETTHKELIRMLCGMFLIILLLDPLPGFHWDLDSASWKDAMQAGKVHAEAGENLARDAQIQRITEAVESYILDKASQEGATLTVKVTLGEDLLPVGAELNGRLESEIQQSLSEMLEKELGIAKENQLWTG